MKKTSLLIVTVLLTGGLSAQNIKNNQNGLSSLKRIPSNSVSVQLAVKHLPDIHHLAKTTGVPFATENFGTGTATTLPTNWTAASVAGTGTWKWRNVACTGAYSVGVINSTSAANGWIVYDSDSIGALTNATTLEGTLTSPSYNCTSHMLVGLTFQQWFRAFNDDCFVQVSNNNFTSFTEYPLVNNSLFSNTYLPSNPHTVFLNISSVAANQANVKIRFRYVYSGPAGGGYNWLVDDMALLDLDPVDVSISRSFVFGSWGEYGATAVTVPLQFIDELEPVTFLSNFGGNSQTAIQVKADIYKGTTSVNSQTFNYASLPINAQDSLIEFPQNYLPTSTGDYTVAFSAVQAGDASLANNLDTFRFKVTDTLWMQNSGAVTGRYSVHSSTTSTTGEESNYVGTRFDVPTGKSDTLTAITVAFHSSTTPNSKVGIQIYKAGQSNWEAKANMVTKTLAASDISPTSGITYATFTPDVAASPSGVNAFILDEGSYAVVAVGDNVPASSTVSILTTDPSTATGYAGFLGQTDASPNNVVNFNFGSTFQTGIAVIPIIRLHFGNASKLGVDNTEILKVAKQAYPNPVDDNLHIPFRSQENADVTVNIVNIMGQIVVSQNQGKINGNETEEYIVNTVSLPNGIYMYVVNAYGQKMTGRFTVVH